MTMAPSAESLIYWSVITPISVFGTVSNLILILALYTKMYKFNRLILQTTAASDNLFLWSYHLWRNLKDSVVYQDAANHLYFGLRYFVVTLRLFLCAAQYFYYTNLLFFQFNPQLVRRKRVVVGMVCVLLWCIIYRTCQIFLDYTLRSEQQLIMSGSFNMLTLILLQLVMIYFVIGLILRIRSQETQHGAGPDLQKMEAFVLKFVIGRTEGLHTEVLKTKRQSLLGPARAHVVRTVNQLSYSSGRHSEHGTLSPSGSQSSDWDSNWDFTSVPQRILKPLRDDARLELHLSKAVIVIGISTTVIYLFGFAPMFATKILYKQDLLFNEVLDVLQCLNSSYLLHVLLVMVPSFRRFLVAQVRGGCKRRRKDIVGISNVKGGSHRKPVDTYSETLSTRTSDSNTTPSTEKDDTDRSKAASNVDNTSSSH